MRECMKTIKIGRKTIGDNNPVYFIADIAANHDGDLDRAKMLISLAKNAGADAVKFQNHNCDKYVSDLGFQQLGKKMSHQSKWKKTIYEIYKDAEIPTDWTAELNAYAKKQGVEYFSTPYDLDMVDILDPYVNIYKIGSGDINWNEFLIKVAKKDKPVIISTGASNIGDVQHAIEVVHQYNEDIILLQCNTNYTGKIENFKYIHLNVLKTYQLMYPDVIVGLSDHTIGHSTVLGAVALGGKVIEKHFTDDNTRSGPDHPFSMMPETWREMVDRTRELEFALGDYSKYLQENESETVILQRRCIRTNHYLKRGDIITRNDIEFQRPAPAGSIPPNDIHLVIGKTLKADVKKGEHISLEKNLM